MGSSLYGDGAIMQWLHTKRLDGYQTILCLVVNWQRLRRGSSVRQNNPFSYIAHVRRCVHDACLYMMLARTNLHSDINSFACG